MMLCLIHWDSTDHFRFNAALVNAPAQHANRMTAERAASGVVVNARFVSGEILVDDESSLDRAVLVDFGHNGFFMGRQAVGTVAIVLVSGKIGAVPVLTVVNTFWCRALFTRARGSIALCMMLAGFDHVWLASLAFVEAARDEPIL